MKVGVLSSLTFTLVRYSSKFSLLFFTLFTSIFVLNFDVSLLGTWSVMVDMGFIFLPSFFSLSDIVCHPSYFILIFFPDRCLIQVIDHLSFSLLRIVFFFFLLFSEIEFYTETIHYLWWVLTSNLPSVFISRNFYGRKL